MWGSQRRRIRQSLELQWKPHALEPCALRSPVTPRVPPPADRPAEAPPSGTEKVLGAVVTAVVSSFLGSPTVYVPGQQQHKTVPADPGYGARQVYLAAADDQPAETKYPLWLAVATDVVAIADSTGQVRWNSVGNGLIDLLPTADGVRLDFSDESYLVVRMSWWSKGRVIQSF
jgi:hypothetical protein